MANPGQKFFRKITIKVIPATSQTGMAPHTAMACSIRHVGAKWKYMGEI